MDVTSTQPLVALLTRKLFRSSVVLRGNEPSRIKRTGHRVQLPALALSESDKEGSGMDKDDAALFLIQEARRETGTRTRMIRTEKALRVLGLDPFERASVMRYLDYWDDTDAPYAQYQNA
jgi:hypothetical protein